MLNMSNKFAKQVPGKIFRSEASPIIFIAELQFLHCEVQILSQMQKMCKMTVNEDMFLVLIYEYKEKENDFCISEIVTFTIMSFM